MIDGSIISACFCYSVITSVHSESLRSKHGCALHHRTTVLRNTCYLKVHKEMKSIAEFQCNKVVEQVCRTRKNITSSHIYYWWLYWASRRFLYKLLVTTVNWETIYESGMVLHVVIHSRLINKESGAIFSRKNIFLSEFRKASGRMTMLKNVIVSFLLLMWKLKRRLMHLPYI